MKKILSKKMAIFSLAISLVLVLSAVAIPKTVVEAAGETDSTWAPIKGWSDKTISPSATNTDFKFNVENFNFGDSVIPASTADFEAPALTLINEGFSLSWADKTADSYNVKLYNEAGTEVIGSKSVNAATVSFTGSEVTLGTTYNIQIEAVTGDTTLYSKVLSYDYLKQISVPTEAYSAIYTGGTEEETLLSEIKTYEGNHSGNAMVFKSTSRGADSRIHLNPISSNIKELPSAISVWVKNEPQTIETSTYRIINIWFLNFSIEGGNNFDHSQATKSADAEGTYIADTGVAYRNQMDKLQFQKFGASTDTIGATVCGRYVFDLSNIPDEERERISQALKDGKKVTPYLTTGSGTTVAVTNTETGAVAAGSLPATGIDNFTYAISDTEYISDYDKWLTNSNLNSAASTGSIYKYNTSYIEDKGTAKEIGVKSGTANIYTYDANVSTKNATLKNADFPDFTYTVYNKSGGAYANRGQSYLEATVTENAGMKLGFTAPKNGVYYLASTLNITSGSAVESRIVIQDGDSLRTAVKKSDVTGTSADGFGIFRAYLKKDETVWLQAWVADNGDSVNDAAVININNPQFTYLTADAQTTPVFDFYNCLTATAFHKVAVARTHCVNNTTAIWKASRLVGNKTDGFTTTSYYELDSDGKFYNGDNRGSGQIRPASRVVFYNGTADIGFSFEFTMPCDGDISFTGSTIYNCAVYKNDGTGDDVLISTGFNGDADGWIEGSLNGFTANDLKKGDIIKFKSYTETVKSGTSAIAPEVTVTPNVTEYDANGSGVVDIVDLLHTKKYVKGVIDGVTNPDALNLDRTYNFKNATSVANTRAEILK